jgi:hypothetical protein
MRYTRPASVPIAVCLAAAMGLAANEGSAAAQSLPAAGRYRCAGPDAASAALDFIVGPGNIYTSARGWRGTMSIHPLSGNVLFLGPTPQNSYQGRYSPGPPPQVTLVTVTGGTGSDTGIVCQMR